MTDFINIGQKLQAARKAQNLTQEQIADKLMVSRQTISNWENNKSYPDILSLIQLSDFYEVSLDSLVKGDDAMIKHLANSTDVVASNHKLILAVACNVILLTLFLMYNAWIIGNHYLILACVLAWIISSGFLFYQIINRI